MTNEKIYFVLKEKVNIKNIMTNYFSLDSFNKQKLFWYLNFMLPLKIS